jgi:thiol-disulfide isomerase/thioredoxin
MPPTSARRSRAPWIIGAVVVVVAVLFAVVTLTSGGGGDTATATSGAAEPGSAAGSSGVVTAPVVINGAGLPALPDNGKDPAVGLAFPGISGSNVLDGSPVAVEADGRPKVVIFLAHWCPHCQAEVPVITAWIAAKGAPTDVDLYAVSTAVAPDRGNFPPASWLVRERWPVTTLADDANSSAFGAAGLTSFPSFVAVGGDGTVRARATGKLSTAQFEALLARARA